MKHVSIITCMAILAGCAAPVFRDSSGAQAPTAALDECKYEALKATANVASATQAGWMQATIERKCMALRGYK